MGTKNIAILHPGEMGASFGETLTASGMSVLWASNSRSDATTRRANKAKMTDVKSIENIKEFAEIILSICPPRAATETANLIAGFEGTFVDMNAIAPEHTRDIASTIEAGNGHFVDGAIVGSPVGQGPRTHLYLSGAGAEDVASLFKDTPIETFVISENIGDASSLKIAYAAWTKGTDALLLAIRAYARRQGIEKSLLEEWLSDSSDLNLRSLKAAQRVATRGWRWAGEMSEIASSFETAGLPEGFHRAAEDIFAKAPRQDVANQDEETLDRVLNNLDGFYTK